MFVSLMCSLLPEASYSELILSSLHLGLCLVAAVKRLPVHHHNADYIFWSFGIIRLILSHFENGVPLKTVLGAWVVLHHHITAHIQSAVFVSLM